MALIQFIFLCGYIHQVNSYYPETHTMRTYSSEGFSLIQKTPSFKEFVQSNPDRHAVRIDSRDGVPCY